MGTPILSYETSPCCRQEVGTSCSAYVRFELACPCVAHACETRSQSDVYQLADFSLYGLGSSRSAAACAAMVCISVRTALQSLFDIALSCTTVQKIVPRQISDQSGMPAYPSTMVLPRARRRRKLRPVYTSTAHMLFAVAMHSIIVRSQRQARCDIPAGNVFAVLDIDSA